MHQEEWHAQALVGELGGEGVDTGEGALGVRVEQGERRAFELPDCGMQGSTRHRRHVGERFRERGDGLLFVQRVAKRPQERDRERLDLLAVDELTRGGGDLGRVEWTDDVAVAVHAFVDTDHATRGNDFGRRREPTLFVVHAATASERHQLFEALRGDQPDLPSDT